MVVLEKCTESTNPRVKSLLECFQIISPDAQFGGKHHREKQNKLSDTATTKPSVRSTMDLHIMAIFYPAKFLLFIGQINKVKTALAWSSGNVKGEEILKT